MARHIFRQTHLTPVEMHLGNRRRFCLVAFVLIAAFFLSLPRATHAEVVLNEKFIRALQDAGFTFRETILKDYTVAPITENSHMNYELAARLNKPPLEVRYAIRPFDPSPREASVKPETMAKPLFQSVVLNVAQRESDIMGMTAFPPESVKAEFNADWGASAMVIPKQEFARGFDRCMIAYIYKQRAGAFMFYLFDSKNMDAALEEVGKVFYALRFR